MVDLFEAEQKILDAATSRVNELQNGASCNNDEFIRLVKEYRSLLKQLRRVTKIYDKTADDLNSSNSDLLDKVHYDALTGLRSRRFLEERLNMVVKSLSRSGEPLSVLMIDVDFFKRYNDTYGHSKGDECLKAVAAALNGSLMRAGDFAARYGGEEFAVILPNTDGKGVCVIASRILENIRALNIPHEKNDAASCVTVSIGAVTDTSENKQEGGDYIKRADEALYMSKQSGRNKYTFLNYTVSKPVD